MILFKSHVGKNTVNFHFVRDFRRAHKLGVGEGGTYIRTKNSVSKQAI